MQKTMQNKPRYQYSIITLLVAVMFVFLSMTDLQAARNLRNHRNSRQSNNRFERVEQSVHKRGSTFSAAKTPQDLFQTLSPEAAKTQLKEICEQVKTNFQKATPNDLQRSQQQLLETTKNLIRTLDGRNADPEAVAASKNFQLPELLATLQTETPDKTVLDTVWNVLHSHEKGVRWTAFDDLRKSLRRYQTLERLIADNNYESQLVTVCDNLLKYIDTYSGNREPLYAIALDEVITWLEDVSVIEQRTSKIENLARLAFSGVNFQAQVSAKFVGAGFNKVMDEELTIDENILGTHVVGSGNISALSSAILMAAKNKAEIRILVDADLESQTTGYHSPVTVNTTTKGTLKAEKLIQLNPESIVTFPTKTQANLKSTTSNLRINAGPLVRGIARSQVEDKKSESQAVARRRAESRMNIRVDERVNPNIAELNENYQTKFRTPLVKAGLFPKIWDISSTPEAIHLSALVGNSTQPSAMNPAPALAKPYDLAIQIHQSTLNNAASIAFSGRFMDEDSTIKDLQKQFKKLPKFLERKQDEAPVQVAFVPKAPVTVLFVDNKFKVDVRLDDIKVTNDSGKAYTITICYGVKVEKKKGDDGVEREVIVVEQAEEPQAFPSNYNPGSGEKLSAVQTMIRSYLIRRLKDLPKRYESEPFELEGEWEGTGALVPVFISSNDGWLTVGCDWEPAEKK